MPNIKSAKKRVEVTKKQNLENRMVKSDLKTALKKVNASFDAGTDKAEALSTAYKVIDKACAKGILHKNNAAHKKAALAKKAAL